MSYITFFENLAGLVPTKQTWRSTSSQPQVDLIQFQVFTSTFNTFVSGRPQFNLRSTWKSTSSAQVSFLGYNKRDVAKWNSSKIIILVIIKGSALPADPKTRKNETYEKKQKNENLQKLIILEGFMQNGLQNRNQHNFLRIKSCVKINFRHSFEKKYDF